jgi:hypothetical protein
MKRCWNDDSQTRVKQCSSKNGEIVFGLKLSNPRENLLLNRLIEYET